MEEKKGISFNITSSLAEKAINLAKEFLDKLIIPSVEEAGLLVKENIASIRFKNQIKILNKAKLYCARHDIKPNCISSKMLCPLLEGASLEEDEEFQEKWSILLGNLVDSEQNIQSNVLPYILGQI